MSEVRFWTLTDVSEIGSITAGQTDALVRTGDLKGIQIGGRNPGRVERVELQEFIDEAFRRTAVNLSDLPRAPPEEADPAG